MPEKAPENVTESRLASPPHGVGRRSLGLGLAVLALGAGVRPAFAQPSEPDPWPALSEQIFGKRPMRDGADVLGIDAPYRAEDAALVPVSLKSLLAPGDARQLRKITLVIDGNPSPLAAVFEIGAESGVDRISTRVRVDDYTNLHAVTELSDGQLYLTRRYVKAAGGCSAPAMKQEAGSIPLGTLRFRQFPPQAGAARREAQIMVRHPNYSGMQMNQVTRLYIPADFISEVTVSEDERKLFSVQSGISIAENPEFRFDYRPANGKTIRVKMVDSDGKVFTGEWPAGDAGI